MCRWLALLVVVHTGFGSQYATNRDGSVFYFPSSLRLRGANQYFHPKIFVWRAGEGVRLYEQRDSRIPAELVGLPLVGLEYYRLESVSVSSDEGRVAVSAARLCSQVRVCSELEWWQSTIRGGGVERTAPGLAVLSPNGRYAVLRSGMSGVTRIDLESGQIDVVSPPVISVVFPQALTAQVANDGTVLYVGADSWFVMRGATRMPLSLPASSVLMNDAGNRFVGVGGSGQLVALSASDRQTRVLGVSVDSSPEISNDASVIAFRWNQQVYVIGWDGRGLTQLTDFEGGAYPRAVSGDGRFVFAESAAGDRIVRIEVSSGKIDEIVPRTAIAWTNGAAPVDRGALFGVSGVSFTERAERVPPPYPRQLSGVTVSLGGVPLPVEYAGLRGVRFQIPWGLPEGYSDVEISREDLDTPFVAGISVAAARPAFFADTDTSTRQGIFGVPVITAAHEDFSGRVTRADPARPSEIIHLYARGLGPVDPVPADGDLAPDQPVRLLPPLSCRVQTYVFLTPDPPGAEFPAEVKFAGLAPRMAGVFQISLRLPPAFYSEMGEVRCRVGDPVRGIPFSGYLPQPGR